LSKQFGPEHINVEVRGHQVHPPRGEGQYHAKLTCLWLRPDSEDMEYTESLLQGEMDDSGTVVIINMIIQCRLPVGDKVGQARGVLFTAKKSYKTSN
jgi:hypothetical protein